MIARVLVDTNVLVYAHDGADSRKQRRAFDLLDRLTSSASLACSTQSLAEFFSVVTRNIPLPLSAAVASRQIELFIQSWMIIDVTPLVVLEATRGVRVHKLSYWDAQIWASARLNQISEVLSEDFSDGRLVEGVRFHDPFRQTFDLDRFS